MAERGRRPRRSPEEERTHRRQRLAAACAILSDHGFDYGAGGHITARDPIDTDHFWINPFGRHFSQVRVSDLLLVDAAGTVVEGTGTINPAGYAIHSRIHERHPQVTCAVHTHSVFGKTFSTLGRLLDPITQDACAFFERHALFSEYSGVVLSLDEGQRIAETIGDGIGVVMQNHGLLTVGGSVEEAVWWFLSMDQCCEVQLRAESAGSPIPIGPDAARVARDEIGTAGIARLNFRPLYDELVARRPELVAIEDG